MKKMLLIITIVSLILSKADAQELVENKVDEFTKLKVKRTSWETAVQNFNTYLFFRVTKIDDNVSLNIKLMYGPYRKAFIITEGMKFMFMMENDSIVSLNSLSTFFSCKGCGARGFSGSSAEGIEANYYINPDMLKILQSQSIKKIRLYTVTGYIEEEVKEKKSDLLKQLLALVE